VRAGRHILARPAAPPRRRIEAPACSPLTLAELALTLAELVLTLAELALTLAELALTLAR
jgi:hypothetical protein